MTRWRLAWVGLLGCWLGSACTCAPTGVDKKPFACATDADCAAGWHCASGRCTSSTTGGGGGSAQGGGSGQGGGGISEGGGSGGGGGTAAGGGSGGGTAGGSGGGGASGGGGGSAMGGGAGGGTGGGTGGGGGGGGGGSSTQDAIVIVTPAQLQLALGGCSADVTFNLLHPDGGLAPVAATTTFDLASSPAGLVFHTGNGCGQSSTTLSLGAGQFAGTFRFTANAAGSYLLSVSNAAYATGTQTETVGYPNPDGLLLLPSSGTLPFSLRAGDCSPGLQVVLTSGGSEVKANQTTTIALATSPAGTGTPAGGLKLFSDSACTVALGASSAIAANASRTATFYVSAETGQSYTLTASTAGLVANGGVNVAPAVRWASCGLDAGQAEVACAVSPAHQNLANTFSIGTNASAENAGASAVRCSLDTTSTLNCTRGEAGGPVQLSLQTAELPKATVVRADAACAGDGGVLVTLSPAVTAAQTVVLLSATQQTSSVGPESFHSASLLSPTQLWLAIGDCSVTPLVHYQLLSLPTMTVDRGSVQLDAGQFAADIAPPSYAGIPLDLASFRAVDGTVDTCSSGLRMENFAGNAQLNRGLLTASCRNDTLAIDWQRLIFNTTPHVVQNTISLAAGQASTSLSLATSFDVTRTLVFTGSQVMGAQGTGEMTGTSSGSSYGNQLLMATPQVSGLTLTGVTFTRADTAEAGKWTVTVVELLP